MNIKLLTTQYDISKQIITNMETIEIKHCYENTCDYNIKIEKIYLIENKLSEEDKLKVVDYHTNNLGSYIINLTKKYWIAIDTKQIKEASYGNLNLNSLKSWFKQYDPRGILHAWQQERYPVYRLFNQKYNLTRDFSTPRTDWGYKMLYDGKNVINQWFHDLLKTLEIEEKHYYTQNDPIQIKITQIDNKLNTLCDPLWKIKEFKRIKNGYRDTISEQRANELDLALNTIELYINNIADSLNNK